MQNAANVLGMLLFGKRVALHYLVFEQAFYLVKTLIVHINIYLIVLLHFYNSYTFLG